MIILNGNKTLKEVALLFDDGPNPLITPRLLEVLQNKGVSANFFLIGMRLSNRQRLLSKSLKQVMRLVIIHIRTKEPLLLEE